MRFGYVVRLLSPRRLAFATLILMLLYLVWTLLSDDYHKKWYDKAALCHTPDQLMDDMIELAFRLHETFDKLKVPHFLCYGTLWGAVRQGGILPWDNNVDFCVLDEDISKVDEAFLYSSFEHAGVMLRYDSRHGFYNVRYKKASGSVTVFQRFFDQFQHAGWEIRLLPFMYTYQHEFPSRLVEKPFPTTNFHGSAFPVPREDFELLKYLYPDDWWREVKPKGWFAAVRAMMTLGFLASLAAGGLLLLFMVTAQFKKKSVTIPVLLACADLLSVRVHRYIMCY